MNKIPMFKVLMSPTAAEEVAKVLASGYVGQGPKVEAFEQILNHMLLQGRGEILTVNSGTSALDLCLHLAGVGPGDEVITTPQTCTATTSAIVNRGAIPVWADIDPRTGLISPASVAERISNHTKAIMAVDWGGALCDYVALKSFGLPVIQDAAHAFGATFMSSLHSYIPMAASPQSGDYIAWSLQAIKHLTTGDGGLIRPPADQIERARKLRWFGLDRRSSADFRCSQKIEESGFKYHMNDIAATIGLCNLAPALLAVDAHRRNACFYYEALDGLDRITLPYPSPGSAWWLFTILVDDRESFEHFMKSRDIDVSQVHARNDIHPAFKMAKGGPMPGVDHFAAHQISIPVGWWLSQDDCHRVVDAVTAWTKS